MSEVPGAPGAASRPVGPVAGVLSAVVRAYQLGLSPLLTPRCRFVPSCSEYALEALRTRGALVGLWLTVRRLARCQPLCRGGYDPVPAAGGIDQAGPDPCLDPHAGSASTRRPVRWEAPPATSATECGPQVPVPVARGARSC